MQHRPILSLILSIGVPLLVACEPEQEGTPLEPQETSQQEEPIAVDDEGVVERDAAAAKAHTASGNVVSVDPANQQLTIEHGRVESLGWPEMTMPFQVADPAMLEGLEAGARIEFVFREAADGQYLIEEIRPVPSEP